MRKASADLLEFLTDKGSYLPLPLGKSATAVSTKGLFHDGDNGPDRIVFDDWSPKMVGEVPFQLIDPQEKVSRTLSCSMDHEALYLLRCRSQSRYLATHL